MLVECSSSLAFVTAKLDLYDDRAFKGNVVTNLWNQVKYSCASCTDGVNIEAYLSVEWNDHLK